MPVLLKQVTDRKKPREIDEEALALKIREKIGPREGEGDSRTLSAIEAATRPLREQIEVASAQLAERGSYKGLSDSHAQLRQNALPHPAITTAAGTC